MHARLSLKYLARGIVNVLLLQLSLRHRGFCISVSSGDHREIFWSLKKNVKKLPLNTKETERHITCQTMIISLAITAEKRDYPRCEFLLTAYGRARHSYNAIHFAFISIRLCRGMTLIIKHKLCQYASHFNRWIHA